MIPLNEQFKEQIASLFPAAEASALLDGLESEPVTAIRLNPAKEGAEMPQGEPVGWCADGRILAERPRFAMMPGWHGGLFYVQEPASMIIGEVVRRIVGLIGRNDLRYLDSCAAPGGKTTTALSALPPEAFAVANEFVAGRANILMENVIKWGLPNAAVTQGDTSAFRKMKDAFDIVAVDAPCSGEGMMRKDEEARRQWSPGLVAQCAALQREILGNVWEALKPGGYLIYSTCTFNRTENEDMLHFIRDELGAEAVDLGLNDEFGIPHSLDSELPAMRFMPHRTAGEGLFMGVMRKPDGEAAHQPKSKKNRKSSSGKGKVPAEMTGWIANPENYSFSLGSDNSWRAIPKAHAELVERLEAATRLMTAGVPLGEEKGKSLIPDAGLALSTQLSKDSFARVEVTEEDALRFLRREAIEVTGPKGYLLVCHEGLPLGFVKNLGNRANNLYPQHWRLRS